MQRGRPPLKPRAGELALGKQHVSASISAAAPDASTKRLAGETVHMETTGTVREEEVLDGPTIIQLKTCTHTNIQDLALVLNASCEVDTCSMPSDDMDESRWVQAFRKTHLENMYKHNAVTVVLKALQPRW